MSQKYYIIILNWNGWLDTKNCIESILQKNNSNNYTIVLVDNGSEAEEVKLISQYCHSNFKTIIEEDKEYFLKKEVELSSYFKKTISKDKIIFIKNNENLGFANGNNVALKFVQNIEENYAILLNNDTEIEDNALDKMFDFLINHKDSSIAAVVPQIRYYTPNNIIWNCGGSINWLGVRKYHYAFSDIKNVPQEGFQKIDYGTGCTLLMDLNKTNILSDKFFFGEEDMELAFRLKKKKLNTYCLYNSIIYHKVGASRGKISKEKMGNMVFHYSMRMSNLKVYLPSFIWFLSFFAHYLSTIRILRKERFFKISKVNNMWKDIYKNVKNIKKYERNDYLNISKKNY